jgi:hypothetical protein
VYDIIGDIHGHADRLVELLTLLGYQRADGTYCHRERKAIFLGDFIDRGPTIREVLQIVRPMIDSDSALAVMGNHEFNALAYQTHDPRSPGEFLRRRNEKNTRQHSKTLEQLPADERISYVEWFRTLPLWLDLPELRVVHACWDERHIRVIQEALIQHGGITESFMQAACTRGAALFRAVEVVLKGKELKLPEGLSFSDKDGHVRTHFRTRWYLPAIGQTVRTYAFQSDVVPCDMSVEAAALAIAEPYPLAAKPVFFGHYWLRAERPSILAANVACVDYSVAKEGFLCAYRFSGEPALSNHSFLWTAIPSNEPQTVPI